MKLKQLLTVGVTASLLLGCVGCEAPKEPVEPELTHKYGVYDGEGVLKYETDNVFAAFIKAGKSSTRSNRYTVYRGKENIFTFSTGKFYKLIGSEFVGTIDATDKDKATKEAQAWAKQNPDSYVINTTATEYVALGRTEMENTVMDDSTFGLELFSGSYVYAYSRRNDADPTFPGVSYMEFTLDMTNMEFKYPKSESEKDWNAYIFSNFFTTGPWGCCDIGLIASSAQTAGVWYPVFNYNGQMITPKTDVITQMTEDKEAGCWRGTDVIEFRAFVTRDAYHLEMKNLTTGKSYAYEASDESRGALQEKADKAFTLLAASYCPVTSGTALWDARSGAVFKGLKFRNPKVAAFNAGAVRASDYDGVEKMDFLPSNTSVFGYGFAQGNDNATYVIGKDEKGSYIETNISYTEDF